MVAAFADPNRRVLPRGQLPSFRHEANPTQTEDAMHANLTTRGTGPA